MQAAQPPAQRCPLTSRPLHTAPPPPDRRTDANVSPSRSPRGRADPRSRRGFVPPPARPGPDSGTDTAQRPTRPSPPRRACPGPAALTARRAASGAARAAGAAAATTSASCRRSSGRRRSAPSRCPARRRGGSRRQRRPQLLPTGAAERKGGRPGRGGTGRGGRCSASFSSSSSGSRSADRSALGHGSAARKFTEASQARRSVTKFVEPYWFLWWGRTTPG